MNKRNWLLLLSITTFIFSACVPKRELISVQKHVKALKVDSTDTHTKLNVCNSHVDSLEGYKMTLLARLNHCGSQLDSLEKYKTALEDSINSISANYQSTVKYTSNTI